MKRVWLITGTSTGFGRGLTERLLAQGERVIATARQGEQIQDFAENYPEHSLVLPLDVTRAEDAAQVVEQGVARFGHIDVLVNNAGYGYFASQEEGDLGQVERMFAVNVFGLIRTTQAVLPTMRAQKSGLIVNLSSIAGKIPLAASGFYNATKFSVEALSEALFYEVAPFGIRVLVIEPGAFATDFSSRSAIRAASLGAPDSPYQQAKTWQAAVFQVMPERQAPAQAIMEMLEAVDQGAPFARVPVGKDAQFTIPQRAELGDELFVKLMAERYQLDLNW